MKFKILLAALAGFSLIACNQDDFVEQQQLPEVQPQYTFTVQWDENATRAEWDVSKVKFEEGDLFSMFHKAGEIPISDGYTLLDPAAPDEESNRQYNYKSFTDLGKYENAIFTGEGTDNNFKLINRSAMIRKGAAFMVYPVDTTFARDNADKTVIQIVQNQPKDYRKILPYVTDLMMIGDWDGTSIEKPHNTAGYNRNYDVLFKPLAGIYRLTLDYANIADFPAGVDAVKIEKVELVSGNYGAFNLDARLVALETTSTLNAYTNNGITYTHFKKQIDVDFDGVTTKNSISTKDIHNGVAHFVIMPHDDNAVAGLVDGDAKIVITTNYGTITVGHDDAKEPITRTNTDPAPGATNEWTVKDGIVDMLQAAWATKKPGSAFTGANAGVSVQRTLSFDLSDIKFEGLVAENSKELTDILAVYEAFGSDEPITIELDTEEEDGGFILTKDAMDKLATIGKGKVTLDEYANSNFIVLQNASDAMFTSFNSVYNGVPVVKFTSSTVNVELRGISTLDQAVDFGKVNNLRNAGALTVTNKVPLTNANPFGKALELVDASSSKDVPVTSLTIASKVYMGKVTTPAVASGKAGVDIFVKAGGTYYAAAGSDFYGRTTIEDGGSLIAYGGAIRNFGTLENSGRLGSDAALGGKFNNGGTIYNKFDKTSTNYTYLNANTLNSPTSYTGIVYLNDRDDEFQVELPGRKGYIVYTAEANSATTPLEVGIEANDKFNYLVVKSTAKDAKVDISGLYIENDDKYAINWLSIEGMSAELISTKANTVKLDALFVRNESLIYKSSNAILSITNLWIKKDFTAPKTKLKYDSMNNGSYASNTYGVQAETFSGTLTSTN
ncbi:hypothetical protein LJC29_07560 [Bacteroides sp. OttesenSCG-928-N06]|nr:hypothetical protein [Bacteroides sp. OttesenSCG-928-N06]